MTNPPAVVLLEGEAGVGKSRLVAEMQGHSDVTERRLLIGHCHALRDPFPLEAVIDALRAASPARSGLSPLAGVLRPLLPEMAGDLPPELTPLEDAFAERHRLFRALSEMLGAEPTMCVLEDLQWADELTIEFLVFLSSELPRRLALVLTYRREDVDASSPLIRAAARLARAPFTVRISLSPLDAGEVRELIAAMLGSDQVSDDLAEYVREQTAGIPLVVEETVGLLRDRGHLVQAGRRWVTRELDGLEVPAAIRDAVVERVGRLSPDAVRVVEAVAVLGAPAEETMISEVAGLAVSRCRAGLVAALSAAVLHEDTKGRYGFRHPLAAHAVYQSMAAPRRRQLHLRAARALASVKTATPLARIARHYREAGSRGPWVHYAEAAADASRALGDERAAARLLQEPLTATALPRSTRIRLALKLGDAELYGEAPHRAVAILRDTLRDKSLPAATRGELRLSLARLLYHSGEADSGREELVRAADELRRRRPGLAARAMVNLALPWQMAGDAGEHRAWLDRAVEMVGRGGDAAARAAVLLHRAAVLLYLGDPAAWRATDGLPTDAGSSEEAWQLVRGYDALARAAYLLGHYPPAERFLDEAERIRDGFDHAHSSLWLLATGTLIQWATGRWQGLEARARRLLEASGEARLVSSCHHQVLGSLALSRGKLDLADASFAQLLEGAQATASVPAVIAAAAGRGWVRLARGNPAAALGMIEPGLEALRGKGAWVWAADLLPAAVEALLACDRHAEARRLVGELAAGLEQRDAPAARAALLECQGALAAAEGLGETAARLMGEAHESWQHLPRPYEAARVGEARGRSLLTRSRQQGAEELLAAMSAFRALGAARDAGRVEAALRTHRVELPRRWRGGRPSYGRRLSPRETEVARLAGTGMSNREIAQSLFLSPRTVEDHVASAIKKLGVSSRRELNHADGENGSASDTDR